MAMADVDVFLVVKPFRAGELLLKKGDPFIPVGVAHVEKLIEQRYLARVYDPKQKAELQAKMGKVERVPAPPPEPKKQSKSRDSVPKE